MFSNIGKKIKTLAGILAWTGIIVSIIIGVAFCVIGGTVFIIVGPIIMILGSIISWVSAFAIYGYGQMIENTNMIVSILSNYRLSVLTKPSANDTSLRK